MKKRRGLVTTAFVIVGAVIGGAVGGGLGTDLIRGGSVGEMKSRKAGIEAGIQETKAKLPILIDQQTVFREVAFDGKTISYYYTISAHFDQINPDFIKTKLRDKLRKELCEGKSSSQNLHSGFRYQYEYQSMESVNVATIYFTKTDCVD